MATVRVVFDVYDVPDNDTGADSNTINALLDQLGAVSTGLSWDQVEWYEIEEEN